MSQRIIEHEFRLRGPVVRLFKDHDIGELVISGPAHTGKSMGIAHYLNWRAENHPGCRILVGRKTRKSLSESWMNTFENKVLPQGHPAKARTISPDHRTHYQYPNGSRIVLGGLDNATRHYSTEWDIVYINECRELNLSEWEEFWRGLRNKKIKHPKRDAFIHQLLGDTNPDAPTHWLKQREKSGQLMMLEQLHKHNPAITQDDIDILANLTGVRRKRLYEGLWVSAEGAIWPDFEPAIHVIDELPRGTIRGYFGSIDWGFRAAGVLQVWAVDDQNRMYLVAEIYRAEMSLEWWIEAANELMNLYNVQVWVADHADAGKIAAFRAAGLPVQEAIKHITRGLDSVRARLMVRDDGQARMYFLRDALKRGRCPVCVERKLPTCTVEEIPEYVYQKVEDGKAYSELPDRDGNDHGCDSARYASIYADIVDLREKQEEDFGPLTPRAIKDSLLDREGYNELMQAAKMGRRPSAKANEDFLPCSY